MSGPKRFWCGVACIACFWVVTVILDGPAPGQEIPENIRLAGIAGLFETTFLGLYAAIRGLLG